MYGTTDKQLTCGTMETELLALFTRGTMETFLFVLSVMELQLITYVSNLSHLLTSICYHGHEEISTLDKEWILETFTYINTNLHINYSHLIHSYKRNE